MRHLLQLVLFATIVSVFFAFLLGGKRPNWRVALVLWGSVVGGAILLGLIMAPFSG
ncbi:MAG: hypothetical protein U0V87_12160 [Acidobacteriota bacterium]